VATHSQVVGIIGIGQLGLPIAINLIQAGYKVVGYRRSGMEEFVARGGQALDSPEAVTRQADILLLCLPSEKAQTEVLHGANGVVQALKPGQIVIELSTYGKAFKIEQARRIEERGGRVLESEVSGSPPMVALRKASLYLGGSATLVEECKPVLDAITAHHFHIGEFGSAVAMKLIANYLLSIHILAAAEAMNLGARAGFDPHMVAEVIKHGAGSSTMFAIRAPMMAARAFTPAIGPFVTLKKYLDLGGAMADELGAASPLFSAAAPYFYRAIDSDICDEDAAAVIKLLEAESQKNPHQGE
jgi:3-hydroxyisobutyrate dehydrogenase